MRTYAFTELTHAALAEIATVHHEPRQPAVWDELARRDLTERQKLALGLIVEKLVDYKTLRANEATIWSRAIYPLLALAEHGDIRAFSLVQLSARFDDIEIRGEADGALAGSIDDELDLPFLVVIEAKRALTATDPMGQLLGAMLCAARLNEQAGRPAREIFGCYTIADLWTFVRGTVDWTGPKPVMSLLSSREHWEKTEAATILGILASIVAKADGG